MIEDKPVAYGVGRAGIEVVHSECWPMFSEQWKAEHSGQLPYLGTIYPVIGKYLSKKTCCYCRKGFFEQKPTTKKG